MDLSRRTFLKAQAAAAAAAAAANVALPAEAQNIPTGEDLQLQWSKAPCRFCGTGCGVMVGGEGRAGRRHPRRHAGGGQSRPQLREGLLPLQDHVRRRPAHPAAPAHEERPVRQGRRVPAGLLGPGLRRDGAAVEARAEGEGPEAVGMFGSGQWTIWEGYAASKLMRGGLPLQQPRPERPPLHGLGRRHLHPHLRHGRADGLLRRFRACRRLRALGLEHGGDAPDPVDPGDRPPPQRIRM